MSLTFGSLFDSRPRSRALTSQPLSMSNEGEGSVQKLRSLLFTLPFILECIFCNN